MLVETVRDRRDELRRKTEVRVRRIEQGGFNGQRQRHPSCAADREETLGQKRSTRGERRIGSAWKTNLESWVRRPDVFVNLVPVLVEPVSGRHLDRGVHRDVLYLSMFPVAHVSEWSEMEVLAPTPR